jgi:oligopeptide/dipeptide ABC transporter ATP-binding protein
VEKASAKELYANPRHPYTLALLSAVPNPEPRRKKDRIVLHGEVPSPANPPGGCPFHPRCPLTRAAAEQSIAGGALDVAVTFQTGKPRMALNVLDFGGTIEIQSGDERYSVLKKCATERPPLVAKQGEANHLAACWVTK